MVSTDVLEVRLKLLAVPENLPFVPGLNFCTKRYYGTGAVPEKKEKDESGMSCNYLSSDIF